MGFPSRISLSITLALSLGCAHAPQSEPISYRPGPYAVHRELEAVRTIPVGQYPKSVQLSPDFSKAYVCNLEGGSVDIIKTDSFERTKRIKFERTPIEISDPPVPSFEEKPVEIAFTEQGRFVWISLLNANGVVIYDSDEKWHPKKGLAKMVTLQDFSSNKDVKDRLRFIATGKQPKVIAVSPEEKYVFVANWMGNDIAIIDAQKFQFIKAIKTGWRPRGICFTNSHAYVANFASNSISEIDLNTLTKSRDLKNVGKNPRHLVVATNGTSLYVSNHGDGHVREVDLVTGKVTKEWSVGKEPRSICLSKSHDYLFVTNYKDDTLTAIDLKKYSQPFTVETLRRPIGVSFNSTDDTVWVSGYWDKAIRVYKWVSRLIPKEAQGSQLTQLP